MKVLVTGASGFVGSAIVRELLARGHDVRLALRRPEPAAAFGASVPVQIIGDLAQQIEWSPLLEGVDAVVHAAGMAHAGRSVPAKRLFAINADATGALARAARRAGAHIIYVSSVRAVAGTFSDETIAEDHNPRPTDDYGRSKLQGELAVAASGAAGAILRPPLVHGAHVKGNLALLARAAASPFPLPLGGLHGRRSIVSDRNLASAVAHLIELRRPELTTALVADGEPLTVSEIAARLRTGRPPRLFAAPGLTQLALAILRRRTMWDTLARPLELLPTRLAARGWVPVEDSAAGLRRTMEAVASR